MEEIVKSNDLGIPAQNPSPKIDSRKRHRPDLFDSDSPLYGLLNKDHWQNGDHSRVIVKLVPAQDKWMG